MKSLLIGRCDSHRVHADEQSCCCLPEPYGRFVVADCSSGLTFIDTCLGLILERGGENDGRDLATQSHLYARPTESSEVNKIGLLDFSLYPSEMYGLGRILSTGSCPSEQWGQKTAVHLKG